MAGTAIVNKIKNIVNLTYAEIKRFVMAAEECFVIFDVTSEFHPCCELIVQNNVAFLELPFQNSPFL